MWLTLERKIHAEKENTGTSQSQIVSWHYIPVVVFDRDMTSAWRNEAEEEDTH